MSMISLYQFLTEEKNYTEADAEETVIRYENKMPIPGEIKKDIKKYWNEKKVNQQA